MKRFTASIEDGPRCWCSTTHADSVGQAVAKLCESYPDCSICCLHEGWSFEGDDLLHGQTITRELVQAWETLQVVPNYVEAQAQAFAAEPAPVPLEERGQLNGDRAWSLLK